MNKSFLYTLVTVPPWSHYASARIGEIFSHISELVETKQSWMINISFVSDEEMQALNKKYRNKDETTDVLSFHYFEDFSDLSDDEVAGECIFSHARILSQAEEYGHTPNTEFEILLIHSILHILGYDHEDDADFEEMFTIERDIRAKMRLNEER